MSTFPLGIDNVDFKLGTTVAVFSHGFGVDRTSNGMFNDIAASLPDDYGYVMFDYYDMINDALAMTTFSEQQSRLSKVIDWATTQPHVNQVVIVAHSMGCVITALLASSKPARTIMLAPPLDIGERTRQYFTSKPGAHKEGGEWVIPRSSGVTTRIPEQMFDEFEQADALAAFIDYARKHPFDLVIAGRDEVLAGQDYKQLARAPITLHTIKEADHNFSGAQRRQLIQLLDKLLLG